MNKLKNLFRINSKKSELAKEKDLIDSSIKQMTQFWVGHFKTEEIASNFFEEVYEEDDDEKPLSLFIASQNEMWLDHDYMETHDFKIKSELKACLEIYSTESEWLIVLEEVFKDLGEKGNFMLVMSSYNLPLSRNKVKTPRTVNSDDMNLVYLGETKSPH